MLVILSTGEVYKNIDIRTLIPVLLPHHRRHKSLDNILGLPQLRIVHNPVIVEHLPRTTSTMKSFAAAAIAFAASSQALVARQSSCCFDISVEGGMPGGIVGQLGDGETCRQP